MSNLSKNWFCYKPVGELSNLSCPRCGAKFPFGPIFDHDPRTCSSCNTRLVEWNMNSGVFVVDVENAPGIIRVIIDHVTSKDEYFAGYELQGLIEFLCHGDDYFTRHKPTVITLSDS